MNRLKLLSIILCLSCIALYGQGQTVRSIEEMDHQHQACLDSGRNMLGCSRDFYKLMDSMLNVVYNKLMTPLNAPAKAALKKEQLDWLAKRDIFFKKQDKIFDDNYKKKNWGPEMQMVTYDDKAGFIKKRVIVLARRLNK